MSTDTDQPEMERGFTLDHVGISVADLSRSIAFYERKLGFVCERTFQMPGRGKVALLRLSGFTIEMFEFAQARPLPEDRRTPTTDLQTIGVKHFALSVTDITGAADYLKRNGVEFISEVAVGVRGLRRFFVKDPDGIGIEITERGPVAADQ